MWRERQRLMWCTYTPRNTKDYQLSPEGRWKAWNKFSLRGLRRNQSWWTPWFQTSGFHNCERISFCCFEPPTLWYFVTAVKGNSPATLSTESHCHQFNAKRSLQFRVQWGYSDFMQCKQINCNNNLAMEQHSCETAHNDKAQLWYGLTVKQLGWGGPSVTVPVLQLQCTAPLWWDSSGWRLSSPCYCSRWGNAASMPTENVLPMRQR